MNIDKMQRLTKKEEIINNLLKTGTEPSTSEVALKLNEFFDSKIPGLPYFAPIKQEPHDVSNIEAYNQVFSALGVDLSMLYNSNIDINSTLMSSEEDNKLKNSQIFSEIEKLQLRLFNIRDTAALGNVTKCCTEVFDNFYNVEFDGDDDRNIPYTTSFVDLAQNKVYSDKYSGASDKINLSEANISVKPVVKPKKDETYGNIQYILKDTLNEVYTYIAYTSEKVSFDTSIEIELKEPKDINNISIKCSSSKYVKALLSISEDGTNFTDLYEISNSSILEWSFDTAPISKFKIKITKSEPDGYNDNNYYEYYFIIENVSASKESYSSKSVYVSKPIEFGALLDTVTLSPEDLIFPNTNINYYIGLDNGVDKIDWKQIESNIPYSLGILLKKNKIVNKSFGDYDNIIDADHDIYSICKVPENININSIKLTPGYQMWYIDAFSLIGTEFENDFDINNFILNDVIDATPINQKRKLFMDCEEYIFSIPRKSLYIMTQFIVCSEETIVSDKEILTEDEILSSSLKVRMFVNGYNAVPIDNKYNIRLKSGINKIQIVLFNDLNSTLNVQSNFNFKEKSFDTFALTPMKQINYYTLKNKTENNTYRYFSIINNDIVVKHDPKDVNNEIIYYMSYKELNPKASSDIVIKDNSKNVIIRVMAVLLSTNNSMSPQILNYRLIGQ